MSTASFDPLAALAEAHRELDRSQGVNAPISASSTFAMDRSSDVDAVITGDRCPDRGGYLYGRHANPTVHALARELAAIEGTEAATCTASGMGAIAATLLQLTSAGDHIVAGRALYGGTFALLARFLPTHTGISTSFVDVDDRAALNDAFTPRTRVLYVETLSNPTLEVAELPELAAIAHAHGAVLVVDNTFAPLLVTPSRHGADVVLHSLTKFIGGASDLIGGAICGSAAFVESLSDLSTGSTMLLGPTMDPRTAFTLRMRLPHLGLRMTEHSRRARVLAERLDALGVDVIYPGLHRHPGHATLASLSNRGYGAGGVLSVETGSRERACAFMDDLQGAEGFGLIAVSLGYFETLMSCSAASTASELTDDELAHAGISPGLVRISVGYTGDMESRWSQLERAVRRAGLVGSRHAQSAA